MYCLRAFSLACTYLGVCAGAERSKHLSWEPGDLSVPFLHVPFLPTAFSLFLTFYLLFKPLLLNEFTSSSNFPPGCWFPYTGSSLTRPNNNHWGWCKNVQSSRLAPRHGFLSSDLGIIFVSKRSSRSGLERAKQRRAAGYCADVGPFGFKNNIHVVAWAMWSV